MKSVQCSLDEMSHEELIRLEQKLGDRISEYLTPITIIRPGDTRLPPGDLHGTGAYVELDGMRYILTCEHVAAGMAKSQLAASFHGAEIAFTLDNPFSALTYPVDIAITAITEHTWNLVPHRAKSIPIELFAKRHEPIPGELMLILGVPGESGHAWPPAEPSGDGVYFYTTNSIVCEVQEYFGPELANEVPLPREGFHFLLPYVPEVAVNVNDKGSSSLPRAPGLSGSLVWNTRYLEVTAAGKEWCPEDARVTGIVWGNSTKAGVLVATPVEYFWELFDHARRCVATDQPYWTPPPSFNGTKDSPI